MEHKSWSEGGKSYHQFGRAYAVHPGKHGDGDYFVYFRAPADTTDIAPTAAEMVFALGLMSYGQRKVFNEPREGSDLWIGGPAQEVLELDTVREITQLATLTAMQWVIHRAYLR